MPRAWARAKASRGIHLRFQIANTRSTEQAIQGKPETLECQWGRIQKSTEKVAMPSPPNTKKSVRRCVTGVLLSLYTSNTRFGLARCRDHGDETGVGRTAGVGVGSLGGSSV